MRNESDAPVAVRDALDARGVAVGRVPGLRQGRRPRAGLLPHRWSSTRPRNCGARAIERSQPVRGGGRGRRRRSRRATGRATHASARSSAAKKLGLSVYRIRPGQSICPYHYEIGFEEWLIVLTGRPTLRTPGGRAGAAAVGLPRSSRTAKAGAHKVTNNTGEDLRVAISRTSATRALRSIPTRTRSASSRRTSSSASATRSTTGTVRSQTDPASPDDRDARPLDDPGCG